MRAKACLSRRHALRAVRVRRCRVGAGDTATAQSAAQEPKKRDITVGLIAAAAAIAVGLCAIGTGLAQGRIGAAGAGTIAEKPESTGTIILLLAIPETMVILGFVVAIVMLFTL